MSVRFNGPWTHPFRFTTDQKERVWWWMLPHCLQSAATCGTTTWCVYGNDMCRADTRMHYRHNHAHTHAKVPEGQPRTRICDFSAAHPRRTAWQSTLGNGQCPPAMRRFGEMPNVGGPAAEKPAVYHCCQPGLPPIAGTMVALQRGDVKSFPSLPLCKTASFSRSLFNPTSSMPVSTSIVSHVPPRSSMLSTVAIRPAAIPCFPALLFALCFQNFQHGHVFRGQADEPIALLIPVPLPGTFRYRFG